MQVDGVGRWVTAEGGTIYPRGFLNSPKTDTFGYNLKNVFDLLHILSLVRHVALLFFEQSNNSNWTLICSLRVV